MTKKRFAQLFPRRKGPRGNCYATSEALFHLLGGKAAGWQPASMPWEGDQHWFLRHPQAGLILDATASQFKRPPGFGDYWSARGRGFLTRHPSRRACELMARMVWQ